MLSGVDSSGSSGRRKARSGRGLKSYRVHSHSCAANTAVIIAPEDTKGLKPAVIPAAQVDLAQQFSCKLGLLADLGKGFALHGTEAALNLREIESVVFQLASLLDKLRHSSSTEFAGSRILQESLDNLRVELVQEGLDRHPSPYVARGILEQLKSVVEACNSSCP